jgi:hypothetical protein
VDRPDAPQLEDGQLGLERNSECTETFSLLAMEPHGGLRVGVSGTALTGLERFDVVAAEHVHVLSNADIKGWIEALSHSRNALQTQGHPATEASRKSPNRASDMPPVQSIGKHAPTRRAISSGPVDFILGSG